MISMRGIRKVYAMGAQQVEALRGVDLEIGGNEYVAVVGPSPVVARWWGFTALIATNSRAR